MRRVICVFFLLCFVSAFIPLPTLPGVSVNCPNHNTKNVCVNNCACAWLPEKNVCVPLSQKEEPYDVATACQFNSLLLTMFGMIVFLVCFVVVASVVCFVIVFLLCCCNCRSKRRPVYDEPSSRGERIRKRKSWHELEDLNKK